MRLTGLVSICLVAALSGFTAKAAPASIGLLDAAETSTELFASENKIDLSRPQPEIYGYSSERHGDFARTRIFKVTERTLEAKTYACEFADVNMDLNADLNADVQTTCWKQKPGATQTFEASPARASIADMQKAAGEVARLLAKEKTSEHAEFTLLKVWSELNGIQVRLGYEIQAIEENYVCQTQPKFSCARATASPIYEP